MSALFSDKYLSPHYRTDILNYISKHYFAKAKSVKEMEFLIGKYKKRVDISRKWIEKYKNKSDKVYLIKHISIHWHIWTLIK